MKTGVVFSVAPLSQVQWSHPMDPHQWNPKVEVVKATVCLNRFELLASSTAVDSDTMRKWAHEQLDAWLNSR